MDLNITETPKNLLQSMVIWKLEKCGFDWKYRSREFGFEVLAKRTSAFLTLQVEVDEDGFCNGETLQDFLETL